MSLNFRMAILFALMSLMAAPAAFAQDNVIDEVAWIVGDEPILKSMEESFKVIHIV